MIFSVHQTYCCVINPGIICVPNLSLLIFPVPKLGTEITDFCSTEIGTEIGTEIWYRFSLSLVPKLVANCSGIYMITGKNGVNRVGSIWVPLPLKLVWYVNWIVVMLTPTKAPNDPLGANSKIKKVQGRNSNIYLPKFGIIFLSSEDSASHASMYRPTPLHGPSACDVAFASKGDKEARTRISCQNCRVKKRQSEIDLFDAKNAWRWSS